MYVPNTQVALNRILKFPSVLSLIFRQPCRLTNYFLTFSVRSASKNLSHTSTWVALIQYNIDQRVYYIFFKDTERLIKKRCLFFLFYSYILLFCYIHTKQRENNSWFVQNWTTKLQFFLTIKLKESKGVKSRLWPTWLSSLRDILTKIFLLITMVHFFKQIYGLSDRTESFKASFTTIVHNMIPL